MNFCRSFVTKFPLAYHWVGLKPFGHLVVDYFDKGVGFSRRAYRDFSTSYTCADLVMGPFMGIVGTMSPLGAYDGKGITYVAATNSRWLPYLANEGIWCVHYSTHIVRR